MSYNFTASEQQQIQNALAQCTGLTWNAAEGAYEEVRFAGTNALPFCVDSSTVIDSNAGNIVNCGVRNEICRRVSRRAANEGAYRCIA